MKLSSGEFVKLVHITYLTSTKFSSLYIEVSVQSAKKYHVRGDVPDEQIG